MEKLNLSLVVITKDEEKNIERCLRSVPFAQDILIVDSHSSDRTVEIAEKLGARVIQEKWRGFGAQKKFAVEQAKFDWILSLDADEAVSEELAAEIRQRFSSLDPQVGYRLPRRSFHLGRWIGHGGWFPDLQLRLFNRQFSNWGDDLIHEHIRAPKTEKLNGEMKHWVFDDLSDQVKTNDRYSGLMAAEMFRRGKKFSLWKLVSKPPVKFLETYLWKAGFLDGLPGFLISVSAAYSVFLKWAKLWEMEQSSRKAK